MNDTNTKVCSYILTLATLKLPSQSPLNLVRAKRSHNEGLITVAIENRQQHVDYSLAKLTEKVKINENNIWSEADRNKIKIDVLDTKIRVINNLDIAFEKPL